MLKKRAVAIGVTAALASLAAAAQDVPSAPAAAASAPAASASAPVAKGAASDDLQRVVVTAQKRKEDILNVPISLSVVSAEQLGASQILDVEDLTRNLPNISFTSQGGPGLGTLEIRGISSQAGSATVSTYIDDVSLTTRNLYSQGTAEPRLFDLDHVEVLRGPQGTLYGSSSLGGTVKYISKQPDLKSFSGTATLDTSYTDHANGWNWQAEGVLNVPLVQNSVALRLGIQSGHQAGWIDQVDYLTLNTIAKGINSADWNVFKGSLKADLGPRWSITPALFVQQYNTEDIDASYLHVGSDQVTPYAGDKLPPFTTSKQVREPGRDRLEVPSLTVNGDVGVGDFTGVVSGYKRRFNRIQDGTSINSVYIGDVTLPNAPPDDPAAEAIRNQVRALPSAVQLNNEIDQTSIELRMASKDYDPKSGNPFTWIGGFYAARAKTQVYDNEPVFGITQVFQQHGLDVNNPNDLDGTWAGAFTGDSSYYSARHYDDRQHSVFGEFTWHATPAVSATAGLRWLSASQHFTREGDYYYSNCGNDPGVCPITALIDTSDTATTPSFKLNWSLDPTTSVYASAAKGFRLGGANRPVPDTPLVEQDLATLGLPGKPPASFAPDSLWSFEVGSKQRLLNNTLNLNLAAFYINWTNIQQDVTLPTAGYDFETNVGRAKSWGLEAELRQRVSSNLDILSAAGYTSAVFAEDVPALGTSTDANGVDYLNVQKGDPVQGVPTGSFSFGYDYHWEINTKVGGFFRGNTQWTGSSHGSLFREDADRNRPSYWNLDLSGGLVWERWQATLYLKNALNNRTAIQHPSVQGVDEAFQLRPRTIGVQVTGDF
jgi:outer membrane receptor protein involved in Fe transport